MSNVSTVSSGTSKAVHRVTWIPKRCWCGASVVAKISKSEANPYRRYYRCAFAASHKLADDNHVFKWFDEAFVNELDTLSTSIARVEKDLKEMASYIADHQQKVMEKAENEAFEKVEEMIGEAKRRLKVTIVVVVVVCMVSVGLMKLV